MNFLKRAISVLAFLALLLTQAAAAERSRHDTLFQFSTINALLHGLYDGDMTLGELARHGDTGLGTINGVDGELIVIEGVFYNVKADGMAYKLASDVKTPFAVMTFFEADQKAGLPADLDYPALQAHLDRLIKGRNNFQAIRIDGTFRRMTVRSEPKQRPPYRPLADVIKKEQVTFDLVGVAGTLIGFRTPDYMASLNVPGYHFHFLTADRKRGGHVLKLTTGPGQIFIDTLTRLEVALPKVPAFNHLDLRGKREGELRAVER